MDDDFIAIDDAAEALQMDRTMLRRLLRDRNIPQITVPGGRRSFMRRADFERLQDPTPNRPSNVGDVAMRDDPR